MKAKPFLIYLKVKNSLIFATAVITLISVSLNLWTNYHQAKAAKLGAWTLVEVISGESRK